MAREDRPRPAAALLLVDKPQGITSHDVVSRVRRAFGTRKVGHAGTLDPMATGLLLIGIEGATRLLTYMVGLDKTYTATIRLGASTSTDDADGEIVGTTDASAVTDDAIASGIAALTGDISQVPSTVSAIKVDGRRAYDLARSGEEVQLKARAVTVSRFDVLDIRRADGVVDLDVVVDCTSGTYIRALARDLGAGLGVGGHLTVLRRTHVGPYEVTAAAILDDALAEAPTLTPAAAAVAVLGELSVSDDEARDLRHGKRLVDAAARASRLPIAAVAPDGALIGVLEKRGGDLKSAMNMPEEA
ncbi:tRNA pseudouridine(55) synthase TruB [Microbacterium gorillae]|uniref:tRNA pseudouridine(55) synthase TruB n=1 Tax=Microbacterium gorillae TaxID=1231063 RepID=UPI00058D3BE1|nr:tRNA pseudouridine(55) synthase TruB [Microbacterium gorillae]